MCNVEFLQGNVRRFYFYADLMGDDFHFPCPEDTFIYLVNNLSRLGYHRGIIKNLSPYKKDFSYIAIYDENGRLHAFAVDCFVDRSGKPLKPFPRFNSRDIFWDGVDL